MSIPSSRQAPRIVVPAATLTARPSIVSSTAGGGSSTGAVGGLDGLCTARKQLDVGDARGQQLAHQVEETRAGLGREAAEGNAAELLAETFDIVRMRVADAANRVLNRVNG